MINAEALAVQQSWDEIFSAQKVAALEELLPDYLRASRWFGGKARSISTVRVVEAVLVPYAGNRAYLTSIRVVYEEGEPQTYVLPLTFATDAASVAPPSAILASLRVEQDGTEGVLYDATADKEFARALLEAIAEGSRYPGTSGEIRASATEAFTPAVGGEWAGLQPSVMRAEQSNTSIVYGERAILKLFRRMEAGTSPDLEIGRFLTERGFQHTPPVLGAIERHTDGRERTTLAVLQGYVSNRGDAWSYTLTSLGEYLSREGEPPGAYVEAAKLLGRRTAEMHIALSQDASSPAFAPEPFTLDYQRRLFKSISSLSAEAFGLLATHGSGRTPEAQAVLARQGDIEARFGPLLGREIGAMRIRCHGDYHLGQVLYTGSDFVIIDFEGEPVRSLEERRRKHSPLKDVSGMIRSYHYAANAGLQEAVVKDRREGLQNQAAAWYSAVSEAYLDEYLAAASGASFLPRSGEDLQVLLDAYLLEKAIYELLYELNNRPDWVSIPLHGIADLLGAGR